ncbi:MAG: hypothetical protein QNK37_10530 [Acidobacteriota bacterium]|nr:hypothetical protein [Acidobacteriota bacterium]
MKRMLVCLFLLTAVGVIGADDKDKNTEAPCKAETKKCAETAAKKDKQAEVKKVDKKQNVQGAAGMVVTLGDRGPDGDAELSPEMRAALEQMVNTSSEGLRQQTLADGTVIVDLEGRFQSAMVVTMGKDGKVKGSCYSTVPDHKCAADHAKAKPEQKKKD